MSKLVLLCSIVGILISGFTPSIAAATVIQAPANRVIINEIKLGGTTTTPVEYITLFNAGDSDVSLAGWKLEYAKTAVSSCQNSSWGVPATQITELSGTLPAHQSSAAISRQLNDSGVGSVHLIDNNATVQDTVGWGTGAPCSEDTSVVTPAVGKSIQRSLSCTTNLPIDTNNNAHDFAVINTPAPGSFSTIYADSCPVTTTPTTPSVPSTSCQRIILSEVLPNPTGSDTGHEFIELYNPTGQAISLTGCSLQTSANSKTFALDMITLQPQEYRAFYDSQTGLSLTNSGATVWLLSPTEELSSTTYSHTMDDDEAWIFLNNTWQSTYQPTPGAANSLYAPSEAPTTTNGTSAGSLTVCKSGQERNPETNRCRNIVSTNPTTSCKPGEAHNPATNRCRSVLAVMTGTACKPGQTRNPQTNRCKAITASSATRKACAPNQIRNPETNRCKKSMSGAAITSVKDVHTGTARSTKTHWLIIGLVLIAALGYAVYEWRQDITLFLRRKGWKIPRLTVFKQLAFWKVHR